MDADPEELRQILDNYGFENLDEMDDEDVHEVAADLHDDLMGEMQPAEEGDGEESEMGDYSDDEEEDEEDEVEMQDEAIDVLNEQIDDLWDKIEEMEQMMSEAATEEEMSELAAADTVEELEETFDKRLSQLEEQSTGGRTLADGVTDGDDGEDFDPVYDDGPTSASSW